MAELNTVDEGTLEAQLARDRRMRGGSRQATRPRIPSVEEVTKKEEPKWTVFSGSQNLAAALNDPSYREYDLFTKTWGSYFVPTAALPPSKIPNIELADFIPYLKETSAVSFV